VRLVSEGSDVSFTCPPTATSRWCRKDRVRPEEWQGRTQIAPTKPAPDQTLPEPPKRRAARPLDSDSDVRIVGADTDKSRHRRQALQGKTDSDIRLEGHCRRREHEGEGMLTEEINLERN